MLGQILVAVQKQGLWRSVSYTGASILLWALNLAWKARKVWYWRWSPLVSEQERLARNAACARCELRKVKDAPSGFFRWAILGHDLFPGGTFCDACGCWDWFLAVLGIKNTREGHICPRGKHPGQTPTPQRKAGGCEGCGKKTNGKRRRPTPARYPGPLEPTELPRPRPDALGQHEDTEVPPQETEPTLPLALS